ncbi:MAG TPA: TonB-dependent receptor, partial [Caulobacteraceae bacterium]|nr:TonB-dependent receptor [Caulobacteraceae bacterium]
MNKFELMRSLGGCAALLASASPALADSGPGSSVDEVVVTATRSAERLIEVPASVSVVSAAEIQDVPAQRLNDTLRLVPGMNLTAIGPDVGHPTAYNEGMRGLPTTETRFLVLMDGVPVNDPFFGYIQWNRIPLDNIDRVEIVRGGGSPLWGNTAMGGVVNVITEAPKQNQLDVDAAGGSYGTYRTSAYGAYRVSDALAFALNTDFSGTSGYQTTPPSWRSFGTPNVRSPVYTPTSFDAKNVGLRSDFAPRDDLTGSVTINYHDNHQLLQTPIGADHQQTWTYSGQIRKTFVGGGALTASLFHDDSNFVTNNPHLINPTTEFDSNIHRTPVNDTGGSLIWSQDLSGILKSYMIGVDAHAISGTDYANYFLQSGQLAVPTIVGGGKQLFVGGFAQVRLQPIEPLEVLASVRYQYYRNYDGIDTFPPAIGAIPASDKTSTDPRINVRYALNQDFAIRGAYYQSFRAPTLDQLYRTFADTTAGIFEGNPFLKPETLQGGEIGFDFNRPGLRSQLTFYDTTINNLVTQRTLSPDESPTVLGVTCGFDGVTFL